MNWTCIKKANSAAWPLAKTFLWATGVLAKQALKGVGVVALMGLVLTILAVFHSTSNGYTTWYLMLPKAHLTLDGKPSGGYLHKTSDGKTIVLTRTDTERHESYWIILTKHPGVSMGRVAPHLPLFAVGDVMFVGEASSIIPTHEPPERRLKTGPKFVEFTADDGKRIRAEW
jgi:hypothetical protein